MVAAQRMQVRLLELDAAAEERAAHSLLRRHPPRLPRCLALERRRVEPPLAADREIRLAQVGAEVDSLQNPTGAGDELRPERRQSGTKTSGGAGAPQLRERGQILHCRKSPLELGDVAGRRTLLRPVEPR